MRKIFFVFAVVLMVSAVMLAACQSEEDVAGEAAYAALYLDKRAPCNSKTVGEKQCGPGGKYMWECKEVNPVITRWGIRSRYTERGYTQTYYNWVMSTEKCRVIQPVFNESLCNKDGRCYFACVDKMIGDPDCCTAERYCTLVDYQKYCAKVGYPCPTNQTMIICPLALPLCPNGTTLAKQEGYDSRGCPLPPKCVNSTALVTEAVKCVFYNSISEQQCYSEKGNCSGIKSCVIEGISGQRGEIVTWKSSCGGYAYTTMDGTNEYANFKCEVSANQTTPTPANETVSLCADADNDGYTPEMIGNCTKQPGDCDDNDSNVYPGAAELCYPDAVDNNCDGNVNEGCTDNTNST